MEVPSSCCFRQNFLPYWTEVTLWFYFWQMRTCLEVENWLGNLIISICIKFDCISYLLDNVGNFLRSKDREMPHGFCWQHWWPQVPETVSNSMGWARTCHGPKCCGARDGSEPRAILSPKGHSVMSGKVFRCHSWGVLLASSGERPGIAAMPNDAQEAPHLETI